MPRERITEGDGWGGFDGPCTACGTDEICQDFGEQYLCYTCWHKAREATPPWHVKRYTTPEHDGKYGHMFFGGGTYMKDEAEHIAEEKNQKCAETAAWWAKEYGADHHAAKVWERYVAEPAECWYGERTAHPGYLHRRRRAIVAAHPEYERKGKLK